MTNAKPWWKSKGMLGGIAAASLALTELADVLQLFPNQSAELDMVRAWAMFFAAILAIYGRVAANTKVTL